jgi:hypothetical protein
MRTRVAAVRQQPRLLLLPVQLARLLCLLAWMLLLVHLTFSSWKYLTGTGTTCGECAQGVAVTQGVTVRGCNSGL